MLVLVASLSVDSHLSSITFRVKGGVEPGHIALLLLLEQIMYKRLSVNLQLGCKLNLAISGVGPLSAS